ncbi:hypothetical protein FD754_010058 [Muntiacus muntjak]|uniref:Ig-like domain-containing protein n=1 Tax=Muntiacus muntjak TaxID=9888 RepID=A0A5N3WVL8_MUNMU|nr:hypothetical protein FD754_010058 [Muntiacus muntjak]
MFTVFSDSGLWAPACYFQHVLGSSCELIDSCLPAGIDAICRWYRQGSSCPLIKTQECRPFWAGSGPSVYEAVVFCVIVITPAITVLKMVILAMSQNKYKHCLHVIIVEHKHCTWSTGEPASDVRGRREAGGRAGVHPETVGFVSEDEYLEIQGITREQSGDYECSASNDVAAPVVRRVKVTVNYPPYISEAKGTGVPVGQKGTLQCEASAVPSAEFQWYKDDKRLVEGKKGVKVENRPFLSKLIFFNVSEHDYGNYTCVASNKLGHTNASITLFEVKTTTLPPGKGPGAVSEVSNGTPSRRAGCLWLLPLLVLHLLLKF